MFGYLRRRATLAGPLGGSRTWTILWAVLVAGHLLRRLTKPKDEVVFSEKLLPGQSLLITGDDRQPRVVGG